MINFRNTDNLAIKYEITLKYKTERISMFYRKDIFWKYTIFILTQIPYLTH